jgi:hypothetical protein
MDWQKGERSQNVEVDSGGDGGGPRFGGGRGLGLGGIVILAILGLVFFKDPTALLSQVDSGGQVAAPTGEPAQVDPQTKDFVSAILGSTEKTWGDIFAAHGQQYVDPKLDLFSGGVNTACGSASTAVGPFYCPGDQKVYLDVAFFQELENRFHASGDFARAYVIAAVARAWKAPMACRCARSCRPIASPVSGPTTASSACSGCSPAISSPPSMPPARSATTPCSNRRRDAWCPIRSPMAPRPNA